jgi:hypothetical protein
MTSSSQGGSPGAGGASAGDRPVIVWHGGNGYYALSIYADGRAVYQMQSGGFGLPSTPPPPIEGRVPSERLAALRSLLASSLDTLRDMRPPLRNLVPGESTQTLDVDWDGLHVKLRMLSNDWSRNPASGACASELHLIATEVAKGR